jgi:RNA polymerase sigma-70 factor (ECF subfamily)
MEHQAAEIWQQVHERLRAFIAKRVGNESEADDLLQEVFMRVHRHIDELREPDRLVSWVFQITRHVLIDYYRAPGRRRELPSGSAEDMAPMHSDLLEEPEAVAGLELSGCLRPMIERLQPEYRQAVTLIELEGLTQKQAADRLGLSLPGMKSRVQRGRKQLKMLLEECCVIELDGRNGVIDFEHRRPDSPSC